MIVTLKLTKNPNRVPTHTRGVGGRDLDRAANGESRIIVVPGRELSTGYPQCFTNTTIH